MAIQKINIKNVGKCSYCASQPVVWNAEETQIGSFVSMGARVTIGMGEHPTHFLSTSPFLYLDGLNFKADKTPSHNEYNKLTPVFIGSDVWIGDDVKIKNGVKIGDGAIIGASAVVTKDVPPYAIVAGVPAKIIRYRFSEDIISELLNLKWWDLDDEVIKQIPYDNINSAIEFLKNYKS